jgi:hypothetical protein
MQIFVSHAADEPGKRIAVRFKELIQQCSDHARIFLSSDWDSIPSGALWLQAVEEALITCDYFIALIARKDDAERLWVNYEVGFARGRRLLPKIIIFSGIKFEQLKYPLQGIHLLGHGDTNRWLLEFSQMGLNVSKESEKAFAALFEHR